MWQTYNDGKNEHLRVKSDPGPGARGGTQLEGECLKWNRTINSLGTTNLDETEIRFGEKVTV